MSKKVKEPKKRLSQMQGKEKRKYILTRLLLVLLIVLIILVGLYFVLDALSPKEISVKTKQKDETYEKYQPHNAEWDKNIYEDEEYTSLSTQVFYGYGEYGGSLFTLDFLTGQEHEGHRFFENYFNILKEGNSKAYTALFHKDYKQEDSFEKNINRTFPPQMVYDIVVRELGRFEDSTSGEALIRSVYLVDYKIHKNDCLFRDDIGYRPEIDSYVTRPLVFELVTQNAGTKNEKTYITNSYTTSSIG